MITMTSFGLLCVLCVSVVNRKPQRHRDSTENTNTKVLEILAVSIRGAILRLSLGRPIFRNSYHKLVRLRAHEVYRSQVSPHYSFIRRALSSRALSGRWGGFSPTT